MKEPSLWSVSYLHRGWQHMVRKGKPSGSCQSCQVTKGCPEGLDSNMDSEEGIGSRTASF